MRLALVEGALFQNEEFEQRLSQQNITLYKTNISENIISRFPLFINGILFYGKNCLDKAKDTIFEIKSESRFINVPVVFLTDEDSDHVLIQALELGFDDAFNITKNVDITTRKILKMASPSQVANKVSHCKFGISLDVENKVAFINSKFIPLTLKEFDLLKEIACGKAEFASRTGLQTTIFGYTDKKNRCLDVHLHNIRRKIEPYGITIESIRSIGCRLKDLR